MKKILFVMAVSCAMVLSGCSTMEQTNKLQPSVAVVQNTTSIENSSTQKTPPNVTNTNSAETHTQKTTDPKTQLQAEFQLYKEHKLHLTEQQAVEFTKQLIKYDKKDALQTAPGAQDMGFAGDLFIQTQQFAIRKWSSIGTETANGIYWVVPIVVNNGGESSLPLNAEMFTLVTSDGRSYSPELAAEAELTGMKPLLFETLNPGLDFDGDLVFDMPPNIRPLDVMLNVQVGFNSTKLSVS